MKSQKKSLKKRDKKPGADTHGPKRVRVGGTMRPFGDTADPGKVHIGTARKPF
jgi:hypothetical protein